MKILRYTLLADGSSDKTLMSVIDWLLNDLYPQLSCESSFADFRKLSDPPEIGNVMERVKFASDYFPFDILFYHRDAEENNKQKINMRKQEVLTKVDAAMAPVTVCIVPIKMMETWLLIDEMAIKKAAGNRNYSKKIDLPEIKKLESVKDPKTRLHDILRMVSGLKGRRLKSFNVHLSVHHVAEYTTDFSALRQLFAFQEFEKDLKTAVNQFLGKI